MTLKTFTAADLRAALERIGIVSGGPVVTHSSLRDLGRMEGVSLSDYPASIVATIRDCLGPLGTLAVPSPNWAYGRAKMPFDIRRSPVSKQLGVISNYVLTIPGVERSLNPIFSVAAIGPDAAFICRGGTASGFGVDSAWDRLFQRDADILFLGCDLNYLTFARYIEQRVGVPYLYNKLFRVPILDDGVPVSLPVTAFLRYAHCPVEYALSRFQQKLRDSGDLRETALGGGSVKAVRMSRCFESGVDSLKQDIHYFLDRVPDYDESQVPLA